MKKTGLLSIALWLLLLCTSFPVSCKNHTEIHLHDRHGLSYSYVKQFAQANGAVTLILLDYHNDIKPESGAVTSYNWVSKLVEEDYVDKVIWLSGKKLLLPNRNSRMDWLNRNLAECYPLTADKMRSAVELVDWYDLQKLKIQKPFVITLDFDVFTKDPGDSPELFVDELCNWIKKQKPELLTLSLSASYQPDAKKAWSWLNRFITKYSKGAAWFLESGDFGEIEESRDDLEAHKIWQENPLIFKNPEYPFYSGAYLWQNCPESLRTALLKKKIQAGNDLAQTIIYGWTEEKKNNFFELFDVKKQKELCELAKKSMNKFFEGTRFAAPLQNTSGNIRNFGVAVRFRNNDVDRGCLSLYEGISQEDIPLAIEYCAQEALTDPRYENITPAEQADLFTNISIFDRWEKMDSCFDYTPGKDSLILQTPDGEKTLLQAAIALEHEYSKEIFLGRLSNKAGLGLNGWKEADLIFYKADTITFTLLSDSTPDQSVHE